MKSKINITYRDKDNNIIINPQEGDKAYSPETGCLYVYTGDEWKMIEGDMGLNMNMYDMNKQIIAQLPILENEAKLEARGTIQEFFNTSNNHYYMLLCKDINYYTVFVLKDESMCPQPVCTAADEVWGCADYIGNIKSVQIENGAIEIWVHPREEDSEPMVMYLFAYDAGVIECTR